jgi:hypothetical protein
MSDRGSRVLNRIVLYRIDDIDELIDDLDDVSGVPCQSTYPPPHMACILLLI